MLFIANRANRIAFIGASIVALATMLMYGSMLQQRFEHIRWYRHIEELIRKLEAKRPADVTEGEWDICILHTWNLHTNFGGAEYFPAEERIPFAAEFERRLNWPVELKTIDWIWDEYARHVPRAAAYMRYRPTQPQILKSAESRPIEPTRAD